MEGLFGGGPAMSAAEIGPGGQEAWLRLRQVEADMVSDVDIGAEQVPADPAQRCNCGAYVYARSLSATHARRLDPETKSKVLLRAWLSPEQRRQYEDKGFFEVVGSKTGNRYHIQEGTQQNVFELDRKGKRFRGWCFVPRGFLPTGDVMLAQKIALETEEEEVMKVAVSFWAETGLGRFASRMAAMWGV